MKNIHVWLKCLLLSVAPIMLIGGLAVAQQQDDLCFMETSSGKRVALSKVCGKSGEKAMDDVIWDENNYDPKYVTNEGAGFWTVASDAPHPFKYPDGSILWPDGRMTEVDGSTSKLIAKDGKVAGVQYYQADGKTPLRPGEQYIYPSGMTVVQEKIGS